jgi:Fe-S-cluster-containing hydrogenase component 2
MNKKQKNTNKRENGRLMKITENCVGCAFCMIICPYDALKVFGRAEINYEKCTGCLKCIMYCPTSSIVGISLSNNPSNLSDDSQNIETHDNQCSGR